MNELDPQRVVVQRPDADGGEIGRGRHREFLGAPHVIEVVAEGRTERGR